MAAVECGTYTVTAGTGNKTISLNDSGFTPVAVILFSTGQSSAGVAASARLGIGFATGTTAAATGSSGDQDGQATSYVSGSVNRPAEAFSLKQIGSGTIQDALADFVSFGAGQFTLNFTTNAAAGSLIHYTVFNAADFQASVQAITPGSTSVPFDAAYTGVGFQPDALLGFSFGQTVDDKSNVFNENFSFGVSDGTSDWCLASYSDHNEATTITDRAQRAKFISTPQNSAAFWAEATVKSLDPDGFTLNYTTVVTDSRLIYVLCLKSTTTSMAVVNDDSPTSDSTVSTACGFTPGAAIFGSWCRANDTGLQAHNQKTIGAWDGTRKISCGTQSEDNVGTTNTDSFLSTTKSMQMTDPSGASVGDADPSASGSNLDIAWTNTDGTARRWFGLVFSAAESSGGGLFMALLFPVRSAVVASLLGVEVLLFSSMGELKASSDFSDVQLAFIDGELFIYDEDESSHPDQLDTVCPTGNSTLHEDDSFQLLGQNWVDIALPHTKILFRTVSMVDVTDGSWTCTDLDLHGAKHDMNVTPPIWKHETGIAQKFGQQHVFAMSYRYASSAGRWLRIRTGGDSPVSPSNLGATGTGDESNLLQWTIELADDLDRDVFIDQEYHYSRLLRPHHDQLVYGKGRCYPGLSVDANAFMDRFRIGNYSATEGIDTFLMSRIHDPAFISLPNRDEGGGGLRMRDLQINGKTYDFDWDSQWNNTEMENIGQSFVTFRDTPTGQGFGGGGHGQTTNSNMRHEFKNVLARNFPSTVLAGNATNWASYMRNVRLGPNLVINRFNYGWTGHVFNMDCYGAFGANHLRWYQPVHCFGFTYRNDGIDVPTVLAKTNAIAVQQGAPIGGINPEPNNRDIREGRLDYPIQLIHGYDGDHTSELPNLGDTNNVISLRRETDLQGVSRRARTYYQDQVSAGTRNLVNFDMLIYNEAFGSASGTDSRGLYSSMQNEATSIVSARDDLEDQYTPNFSIMKPLLDADEWVEHIQVLRSFWRYDYPVVELLRCNVDDPAEGNRVPIFAWFSGSCDNTKDNRLLRPDNGVDEQIDASRYAELEDEPIRFYLKGMSFNIPFDAASGMRSTYRDEFRLIKMAACRTLDSTMVNSQSGIMEWSTGSTITLDTDLMWRPRSVKITPITSDAFAFYDGYEWTGISDPLGDDEDARQPTLQINLNATPTTEDIQFAYWLDVSPY